MENGVPLTSGKLSSLHAMVYFHDVAAIEGRFYVYVRGTELEPGYVTGREGKNITILGGLESILEGVSDIHNDDGEVIIGSDGKNQV